MIVAAYLLAWAIGAVCASMVYHFLVIPRYREQAREMAEEVVPVLGAIADLVQTFSEGDQDGR